MTTANHIITAGVISVAVKQPVLVLPLALASHYIIDAIPHFGFDKDGFGVALKHKITYLELALDSAAIIYLIFLFRNQPVLIYVSAFISISPDFYWLYRYFGFERYGRKPPGGRLTRFHEWIQWLQRPWGLGIEVVYFGLALILFKTIT